MKELLKVILRGYKLFISPLLPPSCRFYPSCSDYAMMSIERYGAARGIVLAIKRVLRCHPFNQGGYDPIPERKER
ncbi:MAG TPA: membrane protein insertion efficiency factor YidD [Deltaproteobacteria bacterium]|nr:membrane protein insertion efficiency factor YidD [Deltaproteobacteria bacterium]